MDRRRFLNYAVVGAAVVGSALTGYEISKWQSVLHLSSPSVWTVTQTIPGPTRTVTTAQTLTVGDLELELFADWHGDGTKQKDEPSITDAVVELSGGGKNDIIRQDSDGKYVLKDIVDGIQYHLSFAKEFLGSFPYRFLSFSDGSFQPIADGFTFVADLAKPQMSLGLMHGFLTLPFPKGTVQQYEPSFVDIDLNSGSWITWQGNRQTYDGHSGTDFIIREGTKILAAAPGRVAGIGDDPNGGIWIVIDHFVQGYSTFYSHLKETSVSVGTKVARGESVGLSGFSIWCRKPTGAYFKCHADHLHFEVDRNGRYVDPYRSRVPNKGNAESLWTKDNDPQFPLAR